MLFPFSFMKTVPVAPVATAATGVGSTSFTANWNAFSGASYYLLDVSLSSSFSTFVLQNTVTTATSYVVTGLTPSTTYYYRIRAAINVDSDVAGFVSRVYTAGGTLSYTEVTATETLVADLKGYGIWSAMKAVYPMVGASAAACAQNLVSSSFTGTFTSGWTFASTGVTPNGTSAYMDTGLNPSTTFGSGYASNGSYFRTTFTVGQTNINGVTNGTQRFDFGYDNGVLIPFNASGSNSSEIGTDTDNRGFLISTRQGASVVKLFRNNVLKINGTQTFTSYPSFNYFVAARNLSGTPLLFSNMGSVAFHFIGDTLTDTQASNFYTAVQTFNQTLNRQVGAQIVSDADAQAYINRVYTAGGTLTNTEANAVNQLTIDMKAAGIWTAMKAVYPMVGSSAAACAQNLKSASFTGTFSSGWTFSSTGATPNGTSAYMDTAFNPVTQSSSQTSFYMSVYIRTNSNAGFPYDIGNANDWNTGVKFTGIITRYLTNTRYIGVCDPYSTGNSETDSRGFYSGGTNGSSTQILYKNGTNVLSGTSAQQGFESNNLYISAVNSIVGGASGFSNKENAFASISDGLSSTQAADFYTCVQTFNTTLSRQV